MMYSNNCVLAVLVNGTPSSELANGTVPIQFDSEYVIRVRNKDKKRRLVAKVFVDGENVTEGGIIVNANSYVDLEAPVDLHKRFKFVSLESPDAVDFGKNGPNPDKSKGLIEAHFHFEKEKMKIVEKHIYHHHDLPYLRPGHPFERKRMPTIPDMTWCSNDTGLKSTAMPFRSYQPNQVTPASLNSFTMEEASASIDTSNLKDGCTVEGSYTNQSFTRTSFDYEEKATVLKIFLQGFSIVKPLDAPASVRRKKSIVQPHEPNVEDPNVSDEELKALRKERIEIEKSILRLQLEALKKELSELEGNS